MFNLEVADNHNYFAGGVLVSNCHYFKRLGFPTRMDGFSVEASKRATDLALKLWLNCPGIDGGLDGWGYATSLDCWCSR